MRPCSRSVLMVAFALPLVCAGQAGAESIVDREGDHPRYALELEPHLALGWGPPGDSGGTGLGAGLRLSIPVADRGLIDGINDSVAIGFGIDALRYSGGGPTIGRCAEYRGSGDERICVRVEGAGGPAFYALLPVVFQWNFFLDPAWSVFAEPGLGVFIQSREFDGSNAAGMFPIFQLGGRYRFSRDAFLTFRIGYPYFSIGASFAL